MTEYKLTVDGWPQRVSDGAFVNPDSNTEYLAWIAAGNMPLPADPTPTDTAEQIISKLWQTAHDYEYAQVSGSAIGLIAIGVLQGKPKCLAVQAWIKALWSEYYSRKAALTQDYDYSVVGPCPHTVPELMAELGL